MIAVIADDLTGAVEIAGAGLRYGLTVEIVSKLDRFPNVDLLVVTTDTRSIPEQEAIKTMVGITDQVKALNPEFLFKKVDSVLRGHVVAELNAHLKQLDLETALLVSANPALGRTLINGNYFVDGRPIHLTGFADDPEFAITSADVHTMLHCSKNDATIHTQDGFSSQKGIIVGECADENDLKKWATKAAGRKLLLAGGSGFFTAILESLGHLQQSSWQSLQLAKPVLFVCGSTFDKSRQLVQQLKSAGGPVSYMPQDIAILASPSDSLYEQWADEVVSLLNLHNKAVVAIHENTTGAPDPEAASLRQKKALLVKKVVEKITIKELLIEGGATASAIIKQLNFDRFAPVHEFSTGVIRMSVAQKDGLFLTLKPGSYNWPEQIWNL